MVTPPPESLIMLFGGGGVQGSQGRGHVFANSALASRWYVTDRLTVYDSFCGRR